MSGRVLVTGGAGFIGSHIAEAYLRDGWEVVVLDDLSRGHERNIPKGARFVRADIRSPEAGKTIAAANSMWSTITLPRSMSGSRWTNLRSTVTSMSLDS